MIDLRTRLWSRRICRVYSSEPGDEVCCSRPEFKNIEIGLLVFVCFWLVESSACLLWLLRSCCSEISELQSFSNVFDNHRKTGRAIEVFPCNVSTVKRLLSWRHGWGDTFFGCCCCCKLFLFWFQSSSEQSHPIPSHQLNDWWRRSKCWMREKSKD